MMGLAFSTLIGLIWLIALCVWVQKVFLVLYDASPEAHFKVSRPNFINSFPVLDS